MKEKMFSLSWKQVVEIILPLAVVAIFTCVSFTNIMNDIISADSARFIGSQSEKVEDRVVNTFEPPSFALNTLAETVGNFSDDFDSDDISSLLQATANQYRNCAAFYFGTALPASNGGYQMTNDGWEAPRGFEHTSRPWFTGAADAGGEIFGSEPYQNSRFGAMCISFSRAVYSRNGDLFGVVGCDIPLDTLSDIVSNISISPNSKVYIVDQNGLYLTHSDSKAIMSRNFFNESAFDASKYNANTMLDGEDHGVITKKNFLAVHKLAAAPWYLIIEGPVSDFTGMFRFWLRVILAIVAVLIIGNVVLNSYRMNQSKQKENKVSESLITETQNLVVAAKENAATAQDQSAAVKEIVATMEDNNSLTETISQKIKDVASIANSTNGNVADGVQFLEENVRQLGEIENANKATIEGIKELGGKIENIWDIVTLINSVADQAKIIAFNAELEASSAGEAGKNFHIVATEIRRLADGIIDSTKEIKASISEIQQSNDSLILASESGTEKIRAGVDNAHSLSEKFESIKNASEITATSSNDITTIIQQQAMATEQILITLKQISAGVENFSAATENISNASQNLKTLADDLKGNIIAEAENAEA